MADCMDLHRVACALNAYMERTGKTKTETAQEMGMTRDSLKNKLSGETEFKATELGALRRITGLSIDALFIS